MFEADRSQGTHRWHVVRLHAGSKTEILLLSHAFFELTTHWVGHTVPCACDDCALCDLLPARGLFYVAGVVMNQVRLLELGAQSASHFEQHAKLLHGGMRAGLVFELSRSGQRQPVRSEVVRFQENVQPISMLVLASHAMALYRFPCANPGDDIKSYSLRMQALAQRRNEQLALEIQSGSRKGVNGRG